MARLGTILATLVLLCVRGGPAAAVKEPESYAELRRRIAAEDRELRRQRWRGSEGHAALERRLLARIDKLFTEWIGSRWGLGMPQSTRPHVGKTNCGLFVAVVLRDAGFRLPIWKFNRQAAYHAIRSLAPRRAIRYFHRRPMKTFLAGVRGLGPGLYLIGLDFHIGFLRVYGDGRVRFVHASYVTQEVVDEPAARAVPIVTSRHRVVGKILQPNMLRTWLRRKRIRVLGDR
jgi:hypothetical protein